MDKSTNKYVVLLLALFFLHTFGVYFPIIGVFVGCVELFFLIFMILKNDFKSFLISLLFIISTSYEFSAFVYGDVSKNVYSCMSLPIVHGYPFLIVLFAPLFIRFEKYIKESDGDYQFLLLNKVKLIMCFFLIQGFILGFISILINDNGIRNINYFSYFVIDALPICSSIALILYFIYALKKIEGFSCVLYNYLFAFIIAVNIAALTHTLFGLHGYYSDSPTVQMPLSFVFSTSALLLFTSKVSRKMKGLLLLSAVISLYLQFRIDNSLGGKAWIIFLLIIVFFVIQMWRRYKVQTTSILMIVILAFGARILINLDSYKNENSKLTQAFMLMTTFSSEAYEVLPSSPKIRIEEFLNSFREFKDKPYYIFGKGFGGSIKDYSNAFGYFEEGAFHKEEYENNSFILVHETINVLFLKFGVVGIIFIIFIVKSSLKNAREDPFILMGLLWGLLFFNYSLCIATVGIPALLLGLYNADIRRLKDSTNWKPAKYKSIN